MLPNKKLLQTTYKLSILLNTPLILITLVCIFNMKEKLFTHLKVEIYTKLMNKAKKSVYLNNNLSKNSNNNNKFKARI